MPAPNEQSIEKIRTIARLKSYTQAATLVAALNASQWAEMESAITRWNAVRDDYTEIEGGLLGANISPRQQRLDITNEVRERLGLNRISEVSDVSGDGCDSINFSTSIPKNIGW
jgi:hypothetical protein